MQTNRTRGREYWPNIKKLFSNWPFIIMFLFVGGAMGYVSTISTKIEQILCSRGYSDQIAGKVFKLTSYNYYLQLNVKFL